MGSTSGEPIERVGALAWGYRTEQLSLGDHLEKYRWAQRLGVRCFQADGRA